MARIWTWIVFWAAFGLSRDLMVSVVCWIGLFHTYFRLILLICDLFGWYMPLSLFGFNCLSRYMGKRRGCPFDFLLSVKMEPRRVVCFVRGSKRETTQVVVCWFWFDKGKAPVRVCLVSAKIKNETKDLLKF